MRSETVMPVVLLKAIPIINHSLQLLYGYLHLIVCTDFLTLFSNFYTVTEKYTYKFTLFLLETRR